MNGYNQVLTNIIEQINKPEFRCELMRLEEEKRDGFLASAIQYMIDYHDYSGSLLFANLASFGDSKINGKMISFLKFKYGLNDELIYRRYIDNLKNTGFNFHGTSGCNMSSIQRRGLLSMNQLYGKDFIRDCNLINQMYFHYALVHMDEFIDKDLSKDEYMSYDSEGNQG